MAQVHCGTLAFWCFVKWRKWKEAAIVAGWWAPGSFELLFQRKKFGRKKTINQKYWMWVWNDSVTGCGRGQKCLFAMRVCRTTPAPPELKPNTWPSQKHSAGVQIVRIYDRRWEALARVLPHDRPTGILLSLVCWQCYCARGPLKDWVCFTPNCSDPYKLWTPATSRLFCLGFPPLNGSLR